MDRLVIIMVLGLIGWGYFYSDRETVSAGMYGLGCLMIVKMTREQAREESIKRIKEKSNVK